MKGYFKSRYSDAPILAFGFHGCRKSVADKVLCDHEDIRDSINDCDWLGRGNIFGKQIQIVPTNGLLNATRIKMMDQPLLGLVLILLVA